MPTRAFSSDPTSTPKAIFGTLQQWYRTVSLSPTRKSKQKESRPHRRPNPHSRNHNSTPQRQIQNHHDNRSLIRRRELPTSSPSRRNRHLRDRRPLHRLRLRPALPRCSWPRWPLPRLQRPQALRQYGH